MNTWVTSLAIGLFSLAGETLPPPTPAITSEHAARLYRIEIYNTYRLNRAEYDRRLAVGEAVWKTFDRAGRPNEQRDEVVAWFIAAREATQRRAALPEAPELSVSAPAVVATPSLEEHLVTSGREESPLVEAVSQDVATKLEIQLPPSAEATEPAQGTVAKQVTATVRSPDPEVEGTTAPIIIELPTGKRVDAAVEAPELPAAKPAAPPAKKEAAAPATGKQDKVPTEDPFAVQNLFEPATTPTPATEAATDVDPFAP
jgi:hypothetical protein